MDTQRAATARQEQIQAGTERPLLVDFGAAQAMLGGLGRTSLYGLINDGQLETVKIGRRIFVTQRSLDSYVDRIAQTASA